MGCRVAQLVDVVVDGRVLGYIGVRGRDIGFRLVVVIVGDKVLHGIVRKEGRKLCVQLGCQRLVGGNDQGRPFCPCYDIGHGEGLA